MPRDTASLSEHGEPKVQYEGVPLREILKRAGVLSGNNLRGKALSTYILTKAQDGCQVVFSLGEIDADFGNEPILIADTRNGKPLAEKQGPLRLICPNDKPAARSVRMLQSLEVVQLRK